MGTVSKAEMKHIAELQINPKEYDIDDVVYYIHKTGHQWRVEFGIVAAHYTGETCLQLIEPVDTRLIEGCLAKDFQTPTEWKKLPKGWSWDTTLFEIDEDEELYDLIHSATINIRDPKSIKAAYQNGILVNVQDNDHCKFETEIADGKWRIIRNYNTPWGKKPTYVSLNFNELYATYEETKQVVDDHESEMKAIAEMSDYDFSVMEIDHTLNRWAAMYQIPEDRKQAFRDRLLSLENVEEVVTRISSGTIQWKYDKNRRWQKIET